MNSVLSFENCLAHIAKLVFLPEKFEIPDDVLPLPLEFVVSITDNFDEDNVIHKGAYGATYRGRLNDHTHVAVKRMDLTQQQHQNQYHKWRNLKKFYSEISFLSKLRHKHLSRLLNYCVDGDERISISEYTSNGTFSDYLFVRTTTRPPLRWTERLQIAFDAAKATRYLHDQAYVHGDLNLESILIDDKLRAKVAIFNMLIPTDGRPLTTDSPRNEGYIAPGRLEILTRPDIYSFGTILMQLITGSNMEGSGEGRVQFYRELFKVKYFNVVDRTLKNDAAHVSRTALTISTIARLCTDDEPGHMDMCSIVGILNTALKACAFIDSYGSANFRSNSNSNKAGYTGNAETSRMINSDDETPSSSQQDSCAPPALCISME